MWLLSNKVLVRECGILDGFCDCHCHLLPGVDDGVQEMGETIEILEEWEDAGVKEVWLTPHIMEDVPNMPEDLKSRYETMIARYQGRVKLHLAAEHMMDGPFLPRLEKGDIMPFGTEQSHLLVETSYYTPPMNMDAIIDQVKAKGFVPILAHPERYQYMRKEDYRYWKEKGVLLQLNLASLVGAYGPEAMGKGEWLLKENMYDYCGSDTHSIEQVSLFLDSMISKKIAKKVLRISESVTMR